MREPEVLGHLLTVRWSSPRPSRHVFYLRFGIRCAKGHSRVGPQWLGQPLNCCIDAFYRDALLPRIRHMLNHRHMLIREQSQDPSARSLIEES